MGLLHRYCQLYFSVLEGSIPMVTRSFPCIWKILGRCKELFHCCKQRSVGACFSWDFAISSSKLRSTLCFCSHGLSELRDLLSISIYLVNSKSNLRKTSGWSCCLWGESRMICDHGIGRSYRGTEMISCRLGMIQWHREFMC